MSDQGFGRDGVVATPVPGRREIPFRFHGSGREFFGIWIVNILLSIVTLGIYSAWAKVRTKRYFNGNTELDGHRFDYHASPVKILIGRIIVVAVLIALNLASQLHPLAPVPVFIIYAIALPWVIVRGLRFNANMTSYRSLRFHFEGRKRDAFLAYVAWPLLAILSLGALLPFASRSSARFLGNGHRYGQAQFAADPPLRRYYRAFGLGLLIFIAAGLVVSLVAGLWMFGVSALVSGDLAETTAIGAIYLGIVTIYLAGIVAFTAYAARSRNIGFNHLSLDGAHSFRSTLTIRRYSWIVITNFLLILITLTLYVPWAKVRMARYLADNTIMIADGDLDRFVGRQVDDSGVTSGEFLDLEGFDFGF